MSAMATMTKWGNGVGLLIPKSARDEFTYWPKGG